MWPFQAALRINENNYGVVDFLLPRNLVIELI